MRNLTVRGQFSGIDLDLHRGEILGLAGLVGAGRSEFLECLFGVTAPDEGEVRLNGEVVHLTSPQAAIRAGFGLVPEERRESGLVLGRYRGGEPRLPGPRPAFAMGCSSASSVCAPWRTI